jgi:signal transduction histidine kinase
MTVRQGPRLTNGTLPVPHGAHRASTGVIGELQPGHTAGHRQHVRAAAELQAAIDAERRHIARELHDTVSQTLHAAQRIAETLPALWASDPTRACAALDDLQRCVRGAVAEMRTLLTDLRPELVTGSPLHMSLIELASSFSLRSEAKLDVQLAAVPLLPPEVQIALYRIAQEALNNVARHARARQVVVQLEHRRCRGLAADIVGGIHLVIADDGIGFERDHVQRGRFGMMSIRERAEEIHAAVHVESYPGVGTTVTVVWSGERTDHDFGRPIKGSRVRARNTYDQITAGADPGS